MWANQKLILGTMSDTPRCPKCNEPPAHTSEMQWCMGWWPFTDENGVEHSHDPNRRTPYYGCANGHHWSDETRRYFMPCPACGKTVEDIDNEKRAAQGLGPVERGDGAANLFWSPRHSSPRNPGRDDGRKRAQ